jgi:hypothetical protein
MNIPSRSENLDKCIDLDDSPNVKQRMETIDSTDLVGRTFLMNNEEDGQRFKLALFTLLLIKKKEERKD